MAGHVRKREHKDAAGKVIRTDYQARYPDPKKSGRRIEKTFARKRDADRWLTGQRAAVDRGDHLDPRESERRMHAVIDEWRSTWTGLEPKTRAGYENIISVHLVPAFGDLRVGQVTPDRVQEFVNKLAARRAPNTVRRVFTVLRGVLKMAVQRRYLGTNPCDAVALPKKPRATTGRDRLYLSAAEVRKLAEGIHPHYRVAVYVAAWCGLRAGELWALRRDDVDLLRGTLRVDEALKEINTTAESMAEDKGIQFGPPKSAAGHRTLTLPGFLRELLRDHLSQPLPGGDGPEALIFTTERGRPVRHSLFYSRVFQPVVKAELPQYSDYANRRGLRFHDLRHTCASLSLAVSPSLHLVKERLGHEDIRTTINIYGHLLPSVDQALAEGLDALHSATEPTNVVAIGR
jgi:integrase